MKITDQLPKVGKARLNPYLLALQAKEAAAVFIAAGATANTARSYHSAFTYWSAWLQLRYGQVLGDTPLTATMAGQFVLDHLVLPSEDGCLTHLLPPDIDAVLVAARIKAKLGPLAFNTVIHRLTVLGQWHRLNHWDSPTDTRALKALLAEARKAQSPQDLEVRKKTAAVLEPLQAMLATCTDGVLGIRDRALLLLAWSGGGRRRSEVVALQLNDVRRLDADTWLFALGGAMANTESIRREKPLRGPAAKALTDWLAVLPAESGPLFPRMYRGGKVGNKGLSAGQVAKIVQHRAKLAGLEGDWAAHSLRSGFVTEASRQGVHLGEIMAMSEYRNVNSVIGYYQNGSLVKSPAINLLPDSIRDERKNVPTAPIRDTSLPAEYIEQEDWDLAIIRKFESDG